MDIEHLADMFIMFVCMFVVGYYVGQNMRIYLNR
jgi:hypothetical protein